MTITEVIKQLEAHREAVGDVETNVQGVYRLQIKEWEKRGVRWELEVAVKEASL